MEAAFYISGAIAVAATVMALSRLNVVHALLYLVVSLLAVAVVFYTLGAPFVAALEVIIYAGAIMVLFVFVVMMLNLGVRATEMERQWLSPGMWIGPSILALLLLAELVYLLTGPAVRMRPSGVVDSRLVGLALYGPYLIGVELASMLLLGGIVGAYHLGWHSRPLSETEYGSSTDRTRTDTGGDLVRAGADRASGAP